MPTLNDTMSLALALHQKGDLGKAANLYRQVLRVAKHPDAQHLLGVIQLQLGEFERALVLFDEALAVQPDNPLFLVHKAQALLATGAVDSCMEVAATALAADPANLAAQQIRGRVFLEKGDFVAAIQSFRDLTSSSPENAEYWNSLGGALRRSGEPEEAEKAWMRAVELRPDFPDAQANLASWVRDRDGAAAACPLFADLVQRNPEVPGIRVAYAKVLGSSGEFAEAMAQLEEATRRAPDHAEAQRYLGDLYFRGGDPTGALRAYTYALSVSDLAPTHYSLGLVRAAIKDQEAALHHFERALELNESHWPSMLAVRQYILTDGQVERADALLQGAIELAPDSPVVLASQATAHEVAGEVSAGRAIALEALERFPKAVGLLRFIVRNPTSETQRREHMARLEVLLAEGYEPDSRRDVERIARMAASFDLAAAYDALGEHASAWKHVVAANAGAMTTWSGDAMKSMVDEIIAHWPAGSLQTLRASPAGAHTPVFIVGLARSGTSLTEQILDSHSAVTGHGELKHLPDAVRLLPGELSLPTFPELASALPGELQDGLAAQYLALTDPGEGKTHATDKLPYNYLYLAWILQLFPNARIIHCNRDWRDTAISNYFQNFMMGHAHTHDLGDMARFTGHYRRVMDHWRKIGVPMHDVHYEAMVSDPETVVRGLLDFLGLPWEDGVLDFHRNRRVVHTASRQQVRKPLYTSSRARWKRYEQWLEPLFAAAPPGLPTHQDSAIMASAPGSAGP